VEYKVSWLCVGLLPGSCGAILELDHRSSQCILNLAFWDMTVVRVEHHNGLEFFIDKMARLHSDRYVTEKSLQYICTHR
jgi:hypothetical protein